MDNKGPDKSNTENMKLTPNVAIFKRVLEIDCLPIISRLFNNSAFPPGASQKTLDDSKPVQIRSRPSDRSHLRTLIWNSRNFDGNDINHSRLSKQDIRAIRGVRNFIPPKGPKRMSDSFCEVLLPFRTDSSLRDEYISIQGGLRFGKLLEDLDALAASIAYLHCDDADVTLVTGAVDRIDLLKSFTKISDVRLRGFVTYVGTSSMEISIAIEMDEGEDAGWELAALAKFVFVARSPDGKEPIAVNKLVLETDREKELFKLGEDRHQYRLVRRERSLFKQPPTEEESQLLHKLLIKTMSDGKNTVAMKNTEMSSLRICHPQERNIHNFTFGGHLLREAFELAYATTSIFLKGQPFMTISLDDLSFMHPVPIGSLLHYSGRIVYTDIDPVDSHRRRLHAEVTADVIDPSQGTRVTTNTFHVTFTAENGEIAPAVVPETYREAMKYLEGKRRVELNDSHHK